MELNNALFGEKEYKVTDTRLFIPLNRPVYEDSKNIISLNSQTKVYCFTARHCVKTAPCTEMWCDNCPEFCTYSTCTILNNGDGPIGGGGSPSGSGPGGSPSGGGTGSEGGNPTTNLPPTCTPLPCNQGTQIINGKVPCGDCGSGPIVIYVPDSTTDLSFYGLDNPVIVEDDPILNNEFTFSDTLESSNNKRKIAETIRRHGNNPEDLQHGYNGNDSGILPNMLLKSDDDLFYSLNTLFNICTSLDGELSDVADEMILKFKNRLGNPYSDNRLKEKIYSSSAFINFIKRFAVLFNSELIRNNYNVNLVSGIDITNIRPIFNGLFNQFNGLMILINDTEYTTIEISDFSFNPITHKWWGVFTIKIEDNFGLDKADVLKYQTRASGFAAWRILQHKRNYYPFKTITEITISLKLP